MPSKGHIQGESRTGGILKNPTVSTTVEARLAMRAAERRQRVMDVAATVFAAISLVVLSTGLFAIRSSIGSAMEQGGVVGWGVVVVLFTPWAIALNRVLLGLEPALEWYVAAL